MRVSAPAIAAACFLLCGANALASDAVTIQAKAGGSYDGREADQNRCSDIIQRAPNSDLPPPDHPVGYPVYAGGGVATAAVGTLLADEMVAQMELARARTAGETLCMHNLGYVDVPLTPDEAASYKKGSSEAWERNFLTGDIAARIKALNIPAVPPLPAYRDEPMMYGGLKIDADSLSLPAPEFNGQGTIVTGKATRVRTAVLVTPIATIGGDIRIAADAGTVFHQVDHSYQREPILRAQTATWCGPVRQTAKGAETKEIYCFTARDNGYEIYRPTGEEWYAGPYKDGAKLPPYTQPIQLTERATDDIGPLDMTIDIVDVHPHYIELVANVARDGKQSEIWSGRYNFNSKGQTIVQLWSRRLLITRATEHSARVKLELAQNGNGQSWRDEDPDPSARP